MHSYNPCLFLFSAQVACLSTAAPTEYLLVSVAWFACSCACLCKLRERQQPKRNQNIGKVCTLEGQSWAFCGKRRANYNQDTHSHRPTIECSCVSCRLRIRSSAPLLGSFGLLPLPGRSTNQTEDTERAEEPSLPTAAAYPHCSIGLRGLVVVLKSPVLFLFIHMQGTWTCTQT